MKLLQDGFEAETCLVKFVVKVLGVGSGRFIRYFIWEQSSA